MWWNWLIMFGKYLPCCCQPKAGHSQEMSHCAKPQQNTSSHSHKVKIFYADCMQTTGCLPVISDLRAAGGRCYTLKRPSCLELSAHWTKSYFSIIMFSDTPSSSHHHALQQVQHDPWNNLQPQPLLLLSTAFDMCVGILNASSTLHKVQSLTKWFSCLDEC